MIAAVNIIKFSQVFKHTLKKQPCSLHMCSVESEPTQNYTFLYLHIYAV